MKTVTEVRLFITQQTSYNNVMKRRRNLGIAMPRHRDAFDVARREIALDAHRQVNVAVKLGHLVKPRACEVCDQEKPLQGHHADYNYPLDVIWCCNTCHRLIHKNCEVVYVV